MNNRIRLVVVALLATTVFISCQKETPEEEGFTSIDNISMENYPKVDGATATWALNRMIACKLLGVEYTWSRAIGGGERGIVPVYEQFENWDESHAFSNFLNERVKNSQTHGAFTNLIDGNADIIVVSSHPSPSEKAHANEKGVTLIETPIALDAFVFIVNEANPVKSLTTEQIRKIYTKQITNWSQVGGTDSEMKVFTRPRNSGSEETLRALVMGGLEPADFPESDQVQGMGAVFPEIQTSVNGICYTFNNYKDVLAQIPEGIAAKIAIDGIFPDKTTIDNRTYPFITEVYAVIRSDLDRNSMAYKLYEWLRTGSAKMVLGECGFSAY
ncbi:substrate-binding domain-containing protein [Bacteroides sp. UBA939]|uniref:substrate-binding domain-containing protein n=1 Tax=Bacteroides sp. UBA939 TaxID=1946092 RepID=UPI0025B83B01|nr:substrate-binding domain-containing protein [Bacteroides sp. UBA939]